MPFKHNAARRHRIPKALPGYELAGGTRMCSGPFGSVHQRRSHPDRRATTSLPLHPAYAASKHAVEGFIIALRRELMAEGAPISVTSVKPGTINTPLFNNSRSKRDVKPMGPPPIYQPDVWPIACFMRPSIRCVTSLPAVPPG